MTDHHEALGCFDAAIAEGWDDALANGDIDRLRDLWERRLSYAYESLRSTQPPAVNDADLLKRAAQSIREFAEFAGDDHSVGICNCQDIRLAEEIEQRLGITKEGGK